MASGDFKDELTDLFTNENDCDDLLVVDLCRL